MHMIRIMVTKLSERGDSGGEHCVIAGRHMKKLTGDDIEHKLLRVLHSIYSIILVVQHTEDTIDRIIISERSEWHTYI